MISTNEKTEKRYVVAYKSDQHTNFVILVYDKNQREYFWVGQRDISDFLKEDNCSYLLEFITRYHKNFPLKVLMKLEAFSINLVLLLLTNMILFPSL